MPTKIQLRRGTASQWTSSNPLLASGEVGVETDSKKFKIGDGSTYWNSLSYSSVTQTAVEGLISAHEAESDPHPQYETSIEAQAKVDAHANLTNNPHSVTKSQVGLSNADNTSDVNKPISSATQTALDLKIDSSKISAANGVASLDNSGKVPVEQLPNSVMEFKGTYDPSTNSPSLSDGSGNAGDVYRISVAGSRNFGSGSITFFVGDLVVYSGSVWQRSPAADGVISVNGYQGAVTLTKSDIGLGSVDNTSDSAKPISSATQSALDLKYDSSNPSGYVNSSQASAAAPVQSVAGHTGSVIVTKSDVGLGSVDDVSAASLRDRSTHTGTQLASTISNFTTAVQGVTLDAAQIDGGGVSNLEFSYLGNVTSDIQSQINGKQATITGAATTITSSDLTISRALASDASGKVTVSATTSTELGYVSGVTSAIQTQLSGKANLSGGNTFSGKQVMTPGATDPGLNLGSVATDPSAPVNGDAWYNSTSHDVKVRKNGVTVIDRPFLAKQVITTGTTYTPTAGAKYIEAILIGGGGGGGGVTGASSSVGAAGGGGSGAMLMIASALTGAASYTVAIGGGGNGGTAGANNGSNGTSTTLTISATTYTAGPGSGGIAQTAGTTAAVVLGGNGATTPTGGTLNTPGTSGGWAYRASSTIGIGAKGADSPYGAGGAAITTAAAGSSATGYGAGGGGAFSTANVNRAGGNGAPGVIIITEYA